MHQSDFTFAAVMIGIQRAISLFTRSPSAAGPRRAFAGISLASSIIRFLVVTSSRARSSASANLPTIGAGVISGLSFHVATGAGPPIFEQLATRNVELVISRMTRGATDKYMVVEKLFEDSYAVAAGPRNPWRHRRKVELAELVNEPWTLPPADSFGSTLITEAFRAHGVEPPRTVATAVSRTLRNRLLATGRFLTMLPGFSVMPDQYPFLKKLPVRLPDTRAPVAVFTIKNRALSPLAQLFLATLRAAVARSIAKGR